MVLDMRELTEVSQRGAVSYDAQGRMTIEKVSHHKKTKSHNR